MADAITKLILILTSLIVGVSGAVIGLQGNAELGFLMLIFSSLERIYYEIRYG